MLYAAILVFLVAGFFAYRGLSSGAPEQANQMRLYCVETGKVVSLPRDDVISIPWKNPATGKRTLFPFEEKEDGIYIPSRYRVTLELDDYKELNQHVDMETLRADPPT